eukprot:15440356-Alexandrium_andersonii.AAC.1
MAATFATWTVQVMRERPLSLLRWEVLGAEQPPVALLVAGRPAAKRGGPSAVLAAMVAMGPNTVPRRRLLGKRPGHASTGQGSAAAKAAAAPAAAAAADSPEEDCQSSDGTAVSARELRCRADGAADEVSVSSSSAAPGGEGSDDGSGGSGSDKDDSAA